MIRPDYDKAATKALEILLEYGISTTPISPLPVLKKMDGVKVRSLTDFSESLNLKRDSVRVLFGQNMDAMTFHVNHPKIRYVVFYNQRLPLYTLQRGLARELGHIVLEHDGHRLPEMPAPGSWRSCRSTWERSCMAPGLNPSRTGSDS